MKEGPSEWLGKGCDPQKRCLLEPQGHRPPSPTVHLPCSSQATQGFSSRSVMYSWTQSSLGSAQTCRPLLVLKLWRRTEGLHTGECSGGDPGPPGTPPPSAPDTSGPVHMLISCPLHPGVHRPSWVSCGGPLGEPALLFDK